MSSVWTTSGRFWTTRFRSNRAGKCRCSFLVANDDSPHFLEAIKYSRKVGYNSVQCATNGIEFAKSKSFAKQAAEAGLRYAYLHSMASVMMPTVTTVGNFSTLKLRAINNLHEAGVEIVLVTHWLTASTTTRSIDHQFALDNPKKIAFYLFSLFSFTGVTKRSLPNYGCNSAITLSHLAHDVKEQVGITEPTRDWFPLSLMGAFADFADLVHGPQANGPGLLRLPSELRCRYCRHDR